MLTESKLKETFIAFVGMIFIFIIVGTATALTLRSMWSDETDPGQGVNVSWFNQMEVQQDRMAVGCFNNRTNVSLYLYTEDKLKNLQLTGAFLQTVTFEFYKEHKKTPQMKVDVYFPGINAERNLIDKDHEKWTNKEADLEKEKQLKDTMALDVWCGTNKDALEDPGKSGVFVNLSVVKRVVYYYLKIPSASIGSNVNGKIILKFRTSEIDQEIARKKLEELGMWKKPVTPAKGDADLTEGMEPATSVGGEHHHRSGRRNGSGASQSGLPEAISFTAIISLANLKDR